jgi:ketosteroid isomerase-like protein
MDEDASFRTTVVPELQKADAQLHNGDPAARIAMWSRRDPVTLFGAYYSGTGWDEILPVFEQLGREFSDCTRCEHEIVAAGQSGDLGYAVALEHTTAAIRDGGPRSYTLRVTTIFRREDGQWRVVHRHADNVVPPRAGHPA